MLTIKVSDELAGKLNCKTAEELTEKLTALATPPAPAPAAPPAPVAAAPAAPSPAAVAAPVAPVAAVPEMDVKVLQERIAKLEAGLEKVKTDAAAAAANTVAEATAAVGGPAAKVVSTGTEPVETIDTLRVAASKETNPQKKWELGKKLQALRTGKNK